jgi:dCMP deaminase
MKEKLILAYMDVAYRFAELSHARRLHVGAIIVKDDRIISIGYNGMPAGWENNCEDHEWMDRGAGGWLNPEEIEAQWPFTGHQWDANGNAVEGRYRLKTKPEVLHAEMNALMKLAKSTESGNAASIFITHAPCMDCAKSIYQAGISEVYYSEDYRTNTGIAFLKQCNIKVRKIDK